MSNITQPPKISYGIAIFRFNEEKKANEILIIKKKQSYDFILYRQRHMKKSGFNINNMYKNEREQVFFSEKKHSKIQCPVPEIWEPPKGRKHADEDVMECAMRETMEETLIPKKSYEIISHKYFEYTKTDGLTYYFRYFIGVMRPGADSKLLIDLNNREQTMEVGDMRWVSMAALEYFIEDKLCLLIKKMNKFIRNHRKKLRRWYRENK